jgi:hypothetical protein
MFDLRPFREVAWIQDDGTKVWIVEAERPLPFGWAWRRQGLRKHSIGVASSGAWGQAPTPRCPSARRLVRGANDGLLGSPPEARPRRLSLSG